MTKQEIEKAIKNGESVWIINNVIFEIELNEETCAVKDNMLIKNYSHPEFYKPQQICSIEYCFSTKAEAEHYLHHANVTRTETLPFLTWEEFDKGNRLIRFIGKNGENCKLEGYSNDEKQSGFIDVVVNGTGSHIDYDYTEANFYKAYDECKRLFLGENDA